MKFTPSHQPQILLRKVQIYKIWRSGFSIGHRCNFIKYTDTNPKYSKFIRTICRGDFLEKVERASKRLNVPCNVEDCRPKDYVELPGDDASVPAKIKELSTPKTSKSKLNSSKTAVPASKSKSSSYQTQNVHLTRYRKKMRSGSASSTTPTTIVDLTGGTDEEDAADVELATESVSEIRNNIQKEKIRPERFASETVKTETTENHNNPRSANGQRPRRRATLSDYRVFFSDTESESLPETGTHADADNVQNKEQTPNKKVKKTATKQMKGQQVTTRKGRPKKVAEMTIKKSITILNSNCLSASREGAFIHMSSGPPIFNRNRCPEPDCSFETESGYEMLVHQNLHSVMAGLPPFVKAIVEATGFTFSSGLLNIPHSQ